MANRKNARKSKRKTVKLLVTEPDQIASGEGDNKSASAPQAPSKAKPKPRPVTVKRSTATVSEVETVPAQENSDLLAAELLTTLKHSGGGSFVPLPDGKPVPTIKDSPATSTIGRTARVEPEDDARLAKTRSPSPTVLAAAMQALMSDDEDGDGHAAACGWNDELEEESEPAADEEDEKDEEDDAEGDVQGTGNEESEGSEDSLDEDLVERIKRAAAVRRGESKHTSAPAHAEIDDELRNYAPPRALLEKIIAQKLAATQPKNRKSQTTPLTGKAKMSASAVTTTSEPDIVPYKISFKVPYGQAYREVQIQSTASWSSALSTFAHKMECQPGLIRLAYTLPWEQKGTKKVAPTILQDDDEWDSLREQIAAHIKTEKAKNHGRGNVKPFSVILSTVDSDGTTMQSAPTAASSGKGSGGSVPATRLSAASDDDGIKQMGQLVESLQARHYCATCKEPCIILPPREHRVLTMKALSKWANLIRNREASLSEFPKQLIPDLALPRRGREQMQDTPSSDARPQSTTTSVPPSQPASIDLNGSQPAARNPEGSSAQSAPRAVDPLAPAGPALATTAPSATTTGLQGALGATLGTALSNPLLQALAALQVLPPQVPPLIVPPFTNTYYASPTATLHTLFPGPPPYVAAASASPFHGTQIPGAGLPMAALAQAAPQTPPRQSYPSGPAPHTPPKQPHYHPSTPLSARGHRRNRSPESASGSLTEDAAPRNAHYPSVADWLLDLDQHPVRGQDRQEYASWTDYFYELGFIRLDDLTDTLGLDEQRLTQLIPEMRIGTASRLLRWAAEDKEWYDSQARSRRARRY